MRIATLVRLQNNYHQLKIIDTPENRESLNIAYQIMQEGSGSAQVDSDAIMAMTGSQEYIDSIISSKNLRERGTVKLDEERKFEVEQLILEGF